MISIINVFKQTCSADRVSSVSLPKYTSCNSCANSVCSEPRTARGAILIMGARHLISSHVIALYTHRTDTVVTCYRPTNKL